MKIGVISDTHIPKSADKIPDSVFNAFKGVDMIIHAGDIADMGVLDELRKITPNIEAVFGNMDSSASQSSLPIKKTIDVNGKRISIMHGWGPPVGLRMRVWNEFKEEKPNVVIYGHSHKAENKIVDGVLFFNPGSPTDKRFAGKNSIGLMTIENGKIDAQIIDL